MRARLRRMARRRVNRRHAGGVRKSAPGDIDVEKQVIRAGVPETGGPINIAVRHGDMVYISGLPPFTPEFSEEIQAARREGRSLPPYPYIPFERQVRLVMDSMKTIMQSVGS